MQLRQFPLALPRDILLQLLDQRGLALPPRGTLVAKGRQSSAESAEQRDEGATGIVGVGVGGFGFFPGDVLGVDAGYEEAEIGDGGLEGFGPAGGGGEGRDWAELAHCGGLSCNGWVFVCVGVVA